MLATIPFFGVPGRSHTGPLPPLQADEVMLCGRLAQHVQQLAGDIGERNLWRYDSLHAAADCIEASLRASGYDVRRWPYQVQERTVYNVEAELAGDNTGAEILIVGAHYDSVPGCPGANDNASGVAAMLEIARKFRAYQCRRVVRFVAFVNEEPPFFQTSRMGSLVYARRARAQDEAIVGMYSLETIGYYSTQPESQQYPVPALFHRFYPSTGDFIAFVSNVASRDLLRQTVGEFRKRTAFPSEGAAAPTAIPGVGWSDHWAFWTQGYPALMVTDTAPYRYPHYHAASDTPDKLDYERLTRVVRGLAGAIAYVAGCDE